MQRDELEVLVRTHQAGLFRYVRFLGADRHAAEDIVQEAFLTAFRQGRQVLAGNPSLRAPWLRGVARRLFLYRCRRLTRMAETPVDEASLERAEDLWAAEFLRGGDGFDYVEALQSCLEELSSDQRRVVNLRYAENRPRSEMAVICGMTENGIKSLLQRIRRALGDCVRRKLALEAGT